MKDWGVKLVEHDVLWSKIFLFKPNYFDVLKLESSDGLEGVYSVPKDQYYKFRPKCFDWWGEVFKIANGYGIRIEVKLVTENYYCGFRFHKPESIYNQANDFTPKGECLRLRIEALLKNNSIDEIRYNHSKLLQIIDGKLPLLPDFNKHLNDILGDYYSGMEGLCFGANPAINFPVNEYLVEYGRKRGFHPWDLADIGLISEQSAEEFTRLDAMRESAELEDRMIQSGQLVIVEDKPSLDLSSTSWVEFDPDEKH